MIKLLRYLFLCIVFFAPVLAWGQATIVKGKVVDAKTNEPIAFAAISIKGTSIGTTSDFDGTYTLEFAKKAGDTLTCVSIGYQKESIHIKKGAIQEINFKLIPTAYNIGEVVIKAGENPAHILLRKIIEHKKENDKSHYKSYNYEVYNKIQFDINDFPKSLAEKKIFKRIKFIFDNIDTTQTGRVFLPLFLTESVSDFYYSKNPPGKKEVIKASKTSGITNDDVNQFLGDMYLNYDIYDNTLVITDKAFVSPISNSGLLFYKYHLVDSTFKGKHWCYRIDFGPRFKQDLTFTGHFWVNDTTFAIKDIEMKANKEANLNFVKEVTIKQEYEQIDGQHWMRTVERVDADLNPIKELGSAGVFAHKHTTYRHIQVDEPINAKIFKGSENIVITDSALTRNEAYWDTIRPDTLTRQQQGVYHMVDTLKKTPFYKRWERFGYMAFTGFIPIGPIEVGPYYSLYTTNTIEGSRFRFGARTSNKFSRRVEFGGYGAYGLRDEEWKYGGLIRWRITKKRRMVLGADYKHDVELIGLTSRANLQLNIAASIGRRHPLNSLIFSDNANLYYEIDWFSGFTQKLTLTNRKFYPAGTFAFNRINSDGSTTPLSSLTTSEVSLMTYFAYDEKYIGGSFDRVSTGTKYPRLMLTTTFGISNILGSQYNYQKLVFSLSDRFYLNPIGFTDYYIEAGKIFGTVPYPLLNVHIGNETYALSNEYLNMANFFEFATDQYARLNVTHHFQGMFLNKIPLMRKLKWREVFVFKALTGSISTRNENHLQLPPGMYNLKGSVYVETGLGIENIFKVFRVDVLWRLTHHDHVDTPRIGLRGAIQIKL